MNAFPATISEPRPDETQYAKEIYEHLGCKDPLTNKFILGALIAIRVFDWKQQRYGTQNIAAAGDYGVRLRLSDKAARLVNMMRRGLEPADETVEDSFGDTAVYGIIGLMCRWGWWPDVPSAHGVSAEEKA